MDKLLTYPGKSNNGIHTFVIDEERGYLTKTANEYHPVIASYINEAKKIPGVMQILLTALGATEFWGPNVNGDGFREEVLAHPGPEYGFETFKHYAKVYKHHVNKNPAASYGSVILAVYNPVYHRVELIVGVDESKAPDIIDRMESGDYPVWSMGCKIPYDVCSICGNKAPTRKQYCEHLRYMLNQIEPETQRLVYADNIRPRFFDISYVLIPADKTAMTLKKVAFVMPNGRTLSSAELAEKAAQIRKASEDKKATMEKEIPAEQPPGSQDTIAEILRGAAEARDLEDPIPSGALNSLSENMSIKEILSSMNALGIHPKPQEFQRLYLNELSKEGRVDPGLADKLEKIGMCFDPLADWGQVKQAHIDAVSPDPDCIQSGAVDFLTPYIEGRSFYAPVLAKRMTKIASLSSMNPMVSRKELSYIGPDSNSNPSSANIAAILGTGALLYLALTSEAISGKAGMLEKVVKSSPKASLAIGAVAALAALDRKDNMPKVRGRFSAQESLQTDTNDIYDRLDRMKQRPYIKFAEETLSKEADSKGQRIGAVGKRLLIGIPSVHLGSTMLQKHKRSNPLEREGRISSLIRKHPNLASGVVFADAMLATKGKGSYAVTKHLAPLQKSWLKGDSLKVAAGVLDDEWPDLFGKSATVSDYVSSSMIWPVAFGTKNLPGRIVGSLFDQAALDAGSKLIEKSKKRSLEQGQNPKR